MDKEVMYQLSYGLFVLTSAAGKTVWRCKACGYIYEGEELPEDFICPLCKHPASDFEKVTL